MIVEESAGLPRLDGLENAVHESEVDYMIAGDDGPAPAIPNPPPTDADCAVAQLIAAEVEDGSCLQVGIGAMPTAVWRTRALVRDSASTPRCSPTASSTSRDRHRRERGADLYPVREHHARLRERGRAVLPHLRVRLGIQQC